MGQEQELAFGGSGLDRAADLRGDVPALAAALTAPGATCLALWRGKLLMTEAEAGALRLVRLPFGHPVLADAREAPVLLGREDGVTVFAHDLSAWQPEGQDLSGVGAFRDASEQVHPALPEARFAELRATMLRLSARDAELAATAKAILGWQASHRFCAACGAASTLHQAGWQRICPDCGAHHFPRTDPVVIMLITRGNRCLLGRSPGWPEGMYSCLAGFVEPGETIEAAVRRETFEEAGIRVGTVRYVTSQPWPFPASLMLGCHGIAEDDTLRVDKAELEDARWITREALADAFAGLDPVLKPARKGSIAHALLRRWLADRLD